MCIGKCVCVIVHTARYLDFYTCTRSEQSLITSNKVINSRFFFVGVWRAFSDKRMKRKAAAAASGGDGKTNRFRAVAKQFRLYKGKDKRRRATDFSRVLDLRSAASRKGRARQVGTGRPSPGAASSSSSKDAQQGTVWEILCVPGLFVVTEALSIGEQAEWSRRAAAEFSKCAHTNLTNLYGPQPDHWADAVKMGCVSPGKGFSRLRWSSLGYHYDWTQRKYNKNEKTDFPGPLADLAKQLAQRVGYTICAEAAIVNYYPPDGMMGGHVDDAERSLLHPIVSVSLGCRAVFLIGGRSRQDEPLPIFLESGDAILMGGYSRLCYHGVPRILAGTCAALVSTLRAQGRCVLADYLRDSRINMNIRQVIDDSHPFDNEAESKTRHVGDVAPSKSTRPRRLGVAKTQVRSTTARPSAQSARPEGRPRQAGVEGSDN